MGNSTSGSKRASVRATAGNKARAEGIVNRGRVQQGAARVAAQNAALRNAGLTRSGQTAAQVSEGAKRRAMAVLKGGRTKVGGGRRG